MMKIHFWKMSGTGNDFVVIDNRRGRITRRSAFARSACDRHEGAGADGLLLLEPSRKASYRMRYYNADGTDGGMCGNGGRCIAWFAYQSGLAASAHSFEALGKLYTARIVRKEWVSLGFPDPSPMYVQWKTRKTHSGVKAISFIDTGSPHAVVKLSEGTLKTFPVLQVGRALREDRSFQPKGTNVNFVEVLSLKHLKIRTYERGVEAETKACGTGAIACSLVGSRLWGMKSPVTVSAPGGKLKVDFDIIDGAYTHIRLEGRARMVYEGHING